MVHPKIRQSKAQNRVLNAAYDLFLQNGLTAVSMQQIAEAAGITKATLYHHFRDKHDLYLATMQLALSRNETALQQSLEGSTSLRELVYALVTYIFGDERADLQRLSTDFRLHVEKESQGQFWKHSQPPWKIVQSAVEGLEDMSEERAIYLSRYVYGAASGLSFLYRFDEESFPITDDVLGQLTDSILHGIMPVLQP